MPLATAEPKPEARTKRQSLNLEPLEPRILLDAAIDIHFVPLLAPSPFDRLDDLPVGLGQVVMGDTFFLEVWVKNADGSGNGIVGGQVVGGVEVRRGQQRQEMQVNGRVQQDARFEGFEAEGVPFRAAGGFGFGGRERHGALLAFRLAKGRIVQKLGGRMEARNGG